MSRLPLVPCLLVMMLVSCGPSTATPPPTHPTATLQPPTPTLPVPTATPWPTNTPTPTPVPGVLFVDATQELGPISPYVYGTNTGPWQGFTSRTMPFVEQGGFTFLRFPGGNWGDEYLLGEEQLDEFIALARRLNAEPMVNVRLYRSTPEQAARWVEYANVERGYNIRYWGIGNEPSLYAANRNLTGYDTATFNAEWRAFAMAMRAVDPTILLVGPEIHQYTAVYWENPHDAAGRDWMDEFLRANGDLVDVVSIHRYPFGYTDPTVTELLGNSAEWDATIPFLRERIRQIAGRDLPIAVTEVNSNWSNRQGRAATPDSLPNAIWWADVLGRLIDQRVEIVAQFALEGAGGLGLVNYPQPRPTYYVYQLYRQFGSQLVYASSDDRQVRVYAARRADGALTVMVVNLGTDAERELLLNGLSPTEVAETWRLDAEHMAEPVEPTPLGERTPLTLPAQSVTLLIVR